MATEPSCSPVTGSEIAVAVMLPPSVPSLHSQLSVTSSLGKRKRGQESAAGSVGAVTSTSYGFAPSVKEKVERFNGGFQCWHCNAPKSHICHVIGRRERVLFQELQSQGRLSIQNPDQAENAIPLCPLCHDALDEISSPGWVFIPTDLQYFLDFERRDYKRRREMVGSTGAYVIRVSPSPGQYLQHQRKKVEEHAHGGLYACYVLRHYVGRIPGMVQMQPGLSPYTEPKPWHGDPMAALSKSFKAVGMTPLAFPTEVRDKLMELSILYSTNDQLIKDRPRWHPAMGLEDDPGPGPCSRAREDAGPHSKTVTRQSGAHAGSRTLLSPKRRRGASEGHQIHSMTLKRKRSVEGACEDIKTPSSDIQDWRKRPMPESHWKWGPRATGEMVVEFYDSIYHIPQKEMATPVEVKKSIDKAPRELLLPSPTSFENNDSLDHPPTPKSPKSPSTSSPQVPTFLYSAQPLKFEKEYHQCIGLE